MVQFVLQSLVHVSTAYKNLDKERIDEVVYPTSISPLKLLQIIDVIDVSTKIPNQL